MADPWDNDPVVPGSVSDAAAVIKAAGGRVTSTDRPTWIKDEVPGGPQSQERLFQLYKAGRGNRAAPPGHSAHESGNGIDFNDADPSALTNAGIPVKKVFWENDHYHGELDPNGAPQKMPWDNDPVVEQKMPWDNDPVVHPKSVAAVATPISPKTQPTPTDAPVYGGLLDETGRALHRTAGMIAGGVGDTFGLIANPVDMVINKVAGRHLFTEDMGKDFRTIIGTPDPRNKVEEYGDKIGEGMVSGGMFSGLAGLASRLTDVKSVSEAMKALANTPVTDMLSGGTSATSVQAAKDAGITNPYALMAIGFLGGAVPFAGHALVKGGEGGVAEGAPTSGEPTIARGEGDVHVDLPNADPSLQDAGLADYFAKVPRDAGDKPTISYEEWKQGQRQAFNDPNDHTKPAIGEVPEAPPLTSRESFDDTSALMERYEAEKQPNESREDFVRRKTAEEFAPEPTDATGNVANDVANDMDLRTRLGDRRVAPREEPTDRRAETPAEDPAKSAIEPDTPVDAYDENGKLVGRYRTLKQARDMKPNHIYKDGEGNRISDNPNTPPPTPSPATYEDLSGRTDAKQEVDEYTTDQVRQLIAQRLAERRGEVPPAEAAAPAPEGPVIDPEGIYQEAHGAGGGKGGGGGDEPPELPPEPPEPPKKGFAGNINLDRIDNTKEVDDLYRDLSKAMPTNADRAQGHTATEDLAKILGKNSAEELVAHNPKLSESPQYAVALRNGLKAAGDRFFSLAKRIAEGDNRPEVLQHFLLTQARMVALMERTMEVTGVGGRLLDSFNIRAKGGTDYKDLFKGVPNDLWNNPENAKKLAELVAAHADNPAAAARIARDSLKPGFADYGFSLWYNWGLLSNPATQAANIFSNTSMNLVNLATHGWAAAIGAVRTGFSKNADRVFGREVAARMYATGKAMAVAGPNMKTAFVEGAPLDQVMRMERPTTFTGKTGMVLEAPTRMMAAQDEFFRTVASLQELYGLSMRQAIKEGHTGQKLLDRADEIAANPSGDMMKKANEAGLIMRFQDKSSGIGRWVEGLRSIHPGDNLAVRSAKNTLRLFIPFLRTTDSLIRTTLRYSPLGVLDRYNLAGLKAGGAERDLAVARLSMGSALTAYAFMKAMNGDITGEGPPDMRARQQLEATGWQANSVKIGGKYINIKGYEPFSTNLTGIATLVEQDGFKKIDDQSVEKSILSHTLDMARTLNSNSWGKSITDMLDLLDPRAGDAKSDNTSAGLISSMTTPAALRMVTQNYVDPVKRDTRGDGSLRGRIEGRIEAGIPGLSSKLPASYDVYGREQKSPDALGPDWLSRLNVKEPDPSPVSHEVQRLSKVAGNKVLVGPPGTTLQGQRIPPPVYEQYQKISGGYIHSYLEGLMQSPDWARMSDDEKIAEIKGTVTDARAQAREELGLVKDNQ